VPLRLLVIERVFDLEEDRSGLTVFSIARDRRVLAIIGTPPHRRGAKERTETDMTTPPQEPMDERTPADRAEGTMSEDEYLGRDGGADGGAEGGDLTEALSGGDGGADGGADSGADSGADDPTTEGEEDTRFA
jgi:hypothetical protein